jgi:hypothetical protein
MLDSEPSFPVERNLLRCRLRYWLDFRLWSPLNSGGHGVLCSQTGGHRVVVSHSTKSRRVNQSDTDQVLIIKRNQSGSYGESDESGHVVYAQPVHQLSSMSFDGLNAYAQDLSDLLGAVSLGDQL